MHSMSPYGEILHFSDCMQIEMIHMSFCVDTLGIRVVCKFNCKVELIVDFWSAFV